MGKSMFRSFSPWSSAAEPGCEVPKAKTVQAVQVPEPETRKAGKDSERSAIDAVLAEFAVYTGQGSVVVCSVCPR